MCSQCFNFSNCFKAFLFIFFDKPIHCNAAAAASIQSCPTLCDPIDGSPPGSRPWDSPGKNIGVGCHCLLQCMKVKSESEVAQSCLDLYRPHGLQPTRLLRPWDFPGKSTGVGCHCLLRYITIGCHISVVSLKLQAFHLSWFSCWNELVLEIRSFACRVPSV